MYFWILVPINNFFTKKILALAGSATASTTLFAIERVSYLPGETICSPRNVVNETVKAREAPTNWNIHFFHGVSRNHGESGAKRCSLITLRSATLLRFYLSPSVAGTLRSMWFRRRIDFRINRDTSTFQPARHFVSFYKVLFPPSRVIALVFAVLPVRCFKRTRGRRGENSDARIASINWILLDSDSCQGTRNWISETLIRLARRSSGSEWNLETAIRGKVSEREREKEREKERKTGGSNRTRFSLPPSHFLHARSRHVLSKFTVIGIISCSLRRQMLIVNLEIIEPLNVWINVNKSYMN